MRKKENPPMDVDKVDPAARAAAQEFREVYEPLAAAIVVADGRRAQLDFVAVRLRERLHERIPRVERALQGHARASAAGPGKLVSYNTYIQYLPSWPSVPDNAIVEAVDHCPFFFIPAKGGLGVMRVVCTILTCTYPVR